MPVLARPADDQPAGYRAGAHGGGQEPVGTGVAVQADAGQQRQGDLELIREGPDQRHHQQRDQQARRAADITQALAQLAAFPAGWRRGAEFLGAYPGQCYQHGREARGVGQEANADAGRGDEHSRHRGADRARGVSHDAVEADRVLHPVPADHLGDESLPSRLIDGINRAQGRRQDEDHPQPHDVGHGQQPEQERQQAQGGLGAQQEAALVRAVSDQAAVGSQQQHGQELGGGHQAQQGAGAGQLQHQPGLRHHLHPGAHQADRLSGEVQPEIRHGQRREHPA